MVNCNQNKHILSYIGAAFAAKKKKTINTRKQAVIQPHLSNTHDFVVIVTSTVFIMYVLLAF